jgi:hypothetical protein
MNTSTHGHQSHFIPLPSCIKESLLLLPWFLHFMESLSRILNSYAATHEIILLETLAFIVYFFGE